jgi:hypothetical protein
MMVVMSHIQKSESVYLTTDCTEDTGKARIEELPGNAMMILRSLINK